MGLAGDPALMGEVGGIVIGGTILLIGLIFGFSSVAADDKYSDSPILGAVTGEGRGKGKSRGKRRGKKRKNTKKKR
jgi:hypothetical protein